MKKTADKQPVAERRHAKVGDLVTVPVAGGKFKGIIVEDRGPIGADGRELYGVVELDAEPTALELPDERFSDLVSYGSDQYVDELYKAIVEAAIRSKDDVIVSYYGLGDIQVRGHSMLQNIPERPRIIERIDARLARDDRVVLRDRNGPGQTSPQKWYAVRAT